MIQNGVVSGGGEKKFNITQNGAYQLFPNDAFAGEILTSASIETPGSWSVMTAQDMQDIPIGTRNAPGLGMMFYFVMPAEDVIVTIS